MFLIDTFQELIDQGGFVIIPMMGITIVLWYVLGERFFFLRTRFSCRFIEKEHRFFKEGRYAKGSLSYDVHDAIEKSLQAAIDANQLNTIPHRLETAFAQIQQSIGLHSVLIRSLVTVAPLLGLLGTVSGMIETFQSLGDMALFAQSGGVAGGIAEALLSTQVGLTIAVPGLVMGRYLDKREMAISEELDQLVLKFDEKRFSATSPNKETIA